MGQKVCNRPRAAGRAATVSALSVEAVAVVLTSAKMCFDIGVVTCGPNEALIISGVFYGSRGAIQYTSKTSQKSS